MVGAHVFKLTSYELPKEFYEDVKYNKLMLLYTAEMVVVHVSVRFPSAVHQVNIRQQINKYCLKENAKQYCSTRK